MMVPLENANNVMMGKYPHLINRLAIHAHRGSIITKAHLTCIALRAPRAGTPKNRDPRLARNVLWECTVGPSRQANANSVQKDIIKKKWEKAIAKVVALGKYHPVGVRIVRHALLERLRVLRKKRATFVRQGFTLTNPLTILHAKST